MPFPVCGWKTDSSSSCCKLIYNTQIEEPCIILQRLSNIYQEFNPHQSICIQKQKAKECRDSDTLPNGNGIWTQWALSNFAMSMRWSPEREMGLRVILLREIRRFDHRRLIFPFDRWIYRFRLSMDLNPDFDNLLLFISNLWLENRTILKLL